MFLRRVFQWGLAFLVVLLLAGVAYYFSRSTAIESWIGSQLLTISGAYINPDMHFKRLQYVRPRTVLLEELSLTSPDPLQPGKTVTILAVKSAKIELAEIPRRGQPLKFSEVRLNSPEIRMIAAGPGQPGFVGFSHFMKGASSATASAPVSTAPGAAATREGPMKLSDWLLIHHVELNDALIQYDRRLPGTQPMNLDQLNLRLDFTRAPAGAAGGSVYQLKTLVDRHPVFQLELDGTIDIDTFVAELQRLAMTLDLQEQNAHFLPPEVQEALKVFEITGKIQMTSSGTLPLADFAKATLHTTMSMQKARAAVGKYDVAIDAFDADIQMANGATAIRKADARLLGGTMQLRGTIQNNSSGAAHLQLDANDVRIEQTLRTLDPRQPPAYAGRVNVNVVFDAPLSKWKSEASGGGRVSLRDGRIGELPMLGQIIEEVNNLLSRTLGQNPRQMSDTADARFVFAGDRVRVESLDAHSGTIALRANGTIDFEGGLDMRMNAGPLEKLQSQMGVIGNIWGAAADSLVGYRVTGTVKSPKVSLQVGH